MSHQPKLFPINPGIVNAITRAGATTARVIDHSRIFVKIPAQLAYSKQRIEAWARRIHLCTMHSVSWDEGPLPGYIETRVDRQPDYYSLAHNGKLRSEHLRYDTYDDACDALSRISDLVAGQPYEGIEEPFVVTVIAVWK